MDNFGPKFVGPFGVLEVVNSNLIIDIEDEKATVNLDQVSIYKFRNDNEFSGMLSGKSKLPWTRKSFTYSSFLSQYLPNDNFRPPKNFGSMNKPQSSYSNNVIPNRNSYQSGHICERTGTTLK